MIDPLQGLVQMFGADKVVVIGEHHPTHFHHLDQTDDLVIGHYVDGDPSTGVVVLLDPEGHECVEAVSALVPWTGGVS